MPKEMNFSVITSNISADFLSPPAVPPWDERKLLYAQVLRKAEPSLIGLQEVTPRQFHFLQEHLPEFAALTVPVINPDPDLLAMWQAKYAHLGWSQIPTPYEIILFYRTDVFELLASDHWWLSPTPDRPSIGFGNTSPRVVLWAQLRHRTSRRDLLIFNTHIDHRCPQPMVELCQEKFAAMANLAPAHIFLGDMNFNPSDSNYQVLIQDGWHDAHQATAVPEAATFLYDLPGIPGGRIDHVLYRGNGLMPQAWARLLPPEPEPRISDHDPVYVRFSLDT